MKPPPHNQLVFDFAAEAVLSESPDAPAWLERAVALYADGKSTVEVARSVGVSAPTVLTWLRRAGVRIRQPCPRGHATAVRKRVVNLYESGRSMRSVALETGVRDSTIKNWLAAAGVPLRPRGTEISAAAQWSEDAVAAWAERHADGLSITDIARASGTTKKTVSKLLRHYGHEVRNPGAPPKRPVPPRAELEAKYAQSGSLEQIAFEYGVSIWVVQRWMELHELDVGGRGSPPVTNEEYFSARTPDRPAEGCWLWQGSLTPPGYGKAMWREGDQTAVMGAHKMAFLLFRGDVPEGMVVRHLCHRRRCCRPDHLEIGTHQDNADDRVQAGRKATHRRPEARHDQHRGNESRLNSRIQKDDDTGCWVWVGGRKATGYGVMVWNPRCDGEPRSVTTHRAAYMIHRGEIPEGAVVRHLCHNKACCNPDHLQLGTIADNVQDEIDAGRTRKGVAHHRTTLTREQVVTMRELRAGGLLHRELAVRFGVSLGAVAAITGGRTWKHVGGPITAPATGTGSGNPTALLTEADVVRIREEVASGRVTQQALAEQYGVTTGTIAHIVHRRTWTHVE